MKFQKVFQLEFNYQLRRVSTWLYFTVVFVLGYLFLSANYLSDAREGYVLLNAPIIISAVAVLCCVFWLLMGGAVAGDAAARDVQTHMFSLTYTSPTSKAEYLGGRFFAALLLNVLILLAIPASILLTIYCTGVEAEVLGPFSLAAYLSAYFYLVLPNAFIATAIQFSMAAISRKAMASYLGGVLLFIAAYLVAQMLDTVKSGVAWGTLVDPMGFTPVISYLSLEWSPIETNTRFLELKGAFLVSRILWLSLALGMLAFTYSRFKFILPETSPKGGKTNLPQTETTALAWLNWGTGEALPPVRGVYGFATHLRQLRLMTWKGFLQLTKSKAGLGVLVVLAVLTGALISQNLDAKEVPLFPRTDFVLDYITTSLTQPDFIWIIISLLTLFYAGELVWRERETSMSEISNAAPVPEWVQFLSRFLALALMLVVWLVLLMTATVVTQAAMGGASPEIGLYLKVLFGLQSIDYLLFALLALAVHVLVNQKYVAHLVMLLIYGFIAFAATLGIEHKLLIFTASPQWTYTDMVGFGSSLGPFLWFKGYWIAWGLLLAVVVQLFWVRGREVSIASRLQQARLRFTRPTALVTAVAAGGILLFGGFIFYNTNVLHDYVNSSTSAALKADYEQRYKKYHNVSQPQLTGVNLKVEMYPAQRAVEIQGTYLLVNNSQAPIDSVHLGTGGNVQTTAVHFDRPAKEVLVDEVHGHRIYALGKLLQPGDSLRLRFQVTYKAQGFMNGGADAHVMEQGINFRNMEWLPVLGYQPYRELDEAGARKAYGLAPRPATASLYDLEARKYAPFPEQISFEAVVGTEATQQVVAPGTLRRTWTKNDRRYFHYATDAPIRNEYVFFSANYAVHEGKWRNSSVGQGQEVDIQIFYPPGQRENPERMVRAAKASLDYYTKQFGPYPHRQLRFVAHASYGFGHHAAPINITAEEGFFLMNPEADERNFDLVTAVVAHEVAHQWWGNQLKQAYVEGAGLITESLAWYSAMGMLEDNYGVEHPRRLLSFLREENETPRTKAATPLLQADDWYQNYRKGPLALYTLSQYMGRDRVNGALKNLLANHPPGKLPLPTSLDLYRELQAATPDSLQPFLHDLFAANTFWELETKTATAKQTKGGAWQVTLTLKTDKLVVDSAGTETHLPIKDWVEVGVYAAAAEGKKGKLLYLQKHFMDSKQKTITVTVPSKPAQAAIDPNYLMIDWNTIDNYKKVKMDK